MRENWKTVDKNGNQLTRCVTCDTHHAGRGMLQCWPCLNRGSDPEKDKAKWLRIAEASRSQQTLGFD